MKAYDALRYSAGLALCVLARLFSFAPNVEPVMGFTMPFAKKFGRYAGMAFAAIAMVSIDFFTHRLGLWTLYTVGAYAVVGYAAGGFFANRKPGRKDFLAFSVAGTLFFDAVTALLFGWQFGQTLELTVLGQIPFTASHLLGNAAFALLASPAILWALGGTETAHPAAATAKAAG